MEEKIKEYTIKILVVVCAVLVIAVTVFAVIIIPKMNEKDKINSELKINLDKKSGEIRKMKEDIKLLRSDVDMVLFELYYDSTANISEEEILFGKNGN